MYHFYLNKNKKNYIIISVKGGKCMANAKLLKLKARKVKVLSRGNYFESPGALKKINRQIAKLESND